MWRVRGEEGCVSRSHSLCLAGEGTASPVGLLMAGRGRMPRWVQPPWTIPVDAEGCSPEGTRRCCSAGVRALVYGSLLGAIGLAAAGTYA